MQNATEELHGVRKVLKTKFTKLDKLMHRRFKNEQRLIECGMISPYGSGHSSSGSDGSSSSDFAGF